jgi:hypothetical protein
VFFFDEIDGDLLWALIKKAIPRSIVSRVVTIRLSDAFKIWESFGNVRRKSSTSAKLDVRLPKPCNACWRTTEDVFTALWK